MSVTDTKLTGGATVAELVDPVHAQLIAQLRAVRRMPGSPGVARLSGMADLIDALGYGDVQRAWNRLLRLREMHGSDPRTDVGAYFYLAGWDIGRESLDQRLTQYARDFGGDKRTALRRGDRGAVKLATIIRDEAEEQRPWGLISVFQGGATADIIVRLMMAHESWRPAAIRINGEDVSDPAFTLHRSADVTGGYYHQLIAEAVPLDTTVDTLGVMASVVVHWPMPVWPTWQTMTHVADPRIWVRTRTFRDRGVEVSLEWFGDHAHD